MLKPSPKSTDARIDRGLRIFNAGLVRKISDGCFVVRSEADDRVYYIVRSDTGCTCPDALQRNYICKHTWSAYASAAMTIWRIQLAESLAELEQLSSLTNNLPTGIKRKIELETKRALERLAA